MPYSNDFLDAFCTHGLLNQPPIHATSAVDWTCFEPIKNNPHIPFFRLANIALDPVKELQTDVFHLETQYVPLPKLKLAKASRGVSETDEVPVDEGDFAERVDEPIEDVWTFKDIIRRLNPGGLVSWDHFLNSAQCDPRSSYISEAGPAGFDSFAARILSENLLSLHAKVACPDTFLVALFELGIGRDSTLFYYNSASETFSRRQSDFGIRGLSPAVQGSVIDRFAILGSQFRGLRTMLQGKMQSTPTVTAFSSCASTILYALETYLVQYHVQVESILQLQDIFHKPSVLVSSLLRLVGTLKPQLGDGQNINGLALIAQEEVVVNPWLEKILYQTVTSTSVPWLTRIEKVVGLPESPRTSHGFQEQGQAQAQDGDQIRSLVCAPGLLPFEVGYNVIESSNMLRLLRTHLPDHPIVRQDAAGNFPVSLCWMYNWYGIIEAQARAEAREEKLRNAIFSYNRDGYRQAGDEGATLDEDVVEGSLGQEHCSFALSNLDKKLRLRHFLGGDGLSEVLNLQEITIDALVSDEKDTSTLTPFFAGTLVESVSALLVSQFRLLSYSVLHLLFKTNKFRSHLQLQHQFHLLGDGVFASRLSHALFDSGQSSSEGRRKPRGTIGLRLDSRDTWPPTSSELRLGLMGILSESCGVNSTSVPAPSFSVLGDALSNTLSFAIRDLSNEDLERCRDPNSIYALDFLRLQYKPASAVLEAVITPTSLQKYDRIFRYLLQLLRLKSVGQALIRDITGRRYPNLGRWRRKDYQFRIDVQHFSCTLMDYAQNVAIAIPWHRFETLIETTETCLDRDDFDETINTTGGLQGLEQKHEETVEMILSALCLDQKQAQVREMLEAVFGLILRFAASTKNNDVAADANHDEMVTAMHSDFRKQVTRVLRYLRAQFDVSSAIDGAAHVQVGPFVQLYERLNILGYYD